jgi:peptide deformylase
MKAFDIKKYPEKILREKSCSVDEIGARERGLLDRMFFTMKHFSGIGLAAPQVGIPERLIVAEAGDKIIKLANPEILDKSGGDSMTEGCLSLPGVGVNVKRPYKVFVRGLDETGKTVDIEAEGLLARVLQHEIDHLNGIVIVNYMSALKRKLFEKNFGKS